MSAAIADPSAERVEGQSGPTLSGWWILPSVLLGAMIHVGLASWIISFF